MIEGGEDELGRIVSFAYEQRTTQSTMINDKSSRSHAICTISIKKEDQTIGKLVLVDLAGSERAYDS